ncbi:MAG TPA: D-2-hydroxyacid dehydrogenase [Bauldia sp.]|nr:D-2-hydroxyacid dehydrogenase [Bauldia sp.]
MTKGDVIKVVFLDRETLSPETVLRPLSFPHALTVFERTAPAEVAGRIADAEIVVTNKVPVRADGIAGAARLKLVAIAATGSDNVDVGACRERGIIVSNIRNYAAHTVPEHTFALILALRRSILAYRDSVARGRWQQAGQFCYFDHPIRDLAGARFGIIGDGVLGTAVAAIAKAFQMETVFADYAARVRTDLPYAPLAQILRTSDVITLHSPLTPETRNMIGPAEFALMERRPLLVNTARGGLVDERALGNALRSGQIAGAAFDVATTEPPPADHPLMQLLDLPNFILTPHVAWASREAIQSLADQLIDNIEAFQRGQPVNVVGKG